MGIFKAAAGSAKGVLADQWKEFFYCEAMPREIVGMRAKKRTGPDSANTKGSDNVITEGSVIAVADGQIAIATEGGKAFACWTEPGEHRFTGGSSSSVFSGGGLGGFFRQMGRRIAFGGDVPVTQRVYYFSTLESGVVEFETPSPIPFRTKDRHLGLDLDAGILCTGAFSYRLTDPILFYNTVCGNFSDTYPRARLVSQLRSEFLTSLQTALAQLGKEGLRASQVPGQTERLCAMLKKQWRDQRGLELVSVGLTLTVTRQDLRQVRDLQRDSVLKDPQMAAAALTGARADAMQAAAKNPGKAAGTVAGVTPKTGVWVCSCGRKNRGKFCEDCGKKRPD